MLTSWSCEVRRGLDWACSVRVEPLTQMSKVTRRQRKTRRRKKNVVTMRTATMSEGKKKLPFGLKGQYRNKGLGLQFSAMSKVKGQRWGLSGRCISTLSVERQDERGTFVFSCREGKGEENDGGKRITASTSTTIKLDKHKPTQMKITSTN